MRYTVFFTLGWDGWDGMGWDKKDWVRFTGFWLYGSMRRPHMDLGRTRPGGWESVLVSWELVDGFYFDRSLSYTISISDDHLPLTYLRLTSCKKR